MIKALIATTALAGLAASQATGGPERPQIVGIAHVTIQVSDLGRARAFYGGVLGLSEPVQVPAMAVFTVNARQRLIVRDGLPPDRDERLVDLGFETDVAAMRPYLAARNVAASDISPAADAGAQQFTVRDPDGHALRFVTRLGVATAGTSPGNRISTRILHAGLTIKDPAAADVFYKDTLGFSETWRGGRPEGTTSWINMRVPGGTDYLEYMLYPGAPPTRQQLGSAHHVALLVTDIQQALETVRARTKPDDRNYRATPSIGVNNRWQLNLFDPDGTRVELMEPWTVR